MCQALFVGHFAVAQAGPNIQAVGLLSLLL